MKMYEASPGLWLVKGVSLQEHNIAMAGNYVPDEYELEHPGKSLLIENDSAHIWVTKDGRCIPYQKLTNEHLHNIHGLMGGALHLTPNLRAEIRRREESTS